MITNLCEALEHAARVYGAPMVTTTGAWDHPLKTLAFGDIDINGKHQTEFVISANKKTVYHKRTGSKVQVFSEHTFVTGDELADRMAEYSEQFTVRKPEPCRVDRDTLRRYERRFSSAARWAGALVQAQRVNAVDALCRESFASLMDNRALMGGAI